MESKSARRAHQEGLTARAIEDHDALTSAIELLEHALAEAAVHREQPWSERAGRALERVREAVRSHVRGVEAPEGLFDEVVAVAPRLQKRVTAVREDHIALATRATDLAAGLAAHQNHNVVALRHQAEALLSDLREHRGTEADLVYEAFWTDLGGRN
jgi:ElaB/YqjD/DUF883 family membrane-anchored ribosome-binding protein